MPSTLECYVPARQIHLEEAGSWFAEHSVEGNDNVQHREVMYSLAHFDSPASASQVMHRYRRSNRSLVLVEAAGAVDCFDQVAGMNKALEVVVDHL